MNLFSVQAKAIMLGVHLAALVAGILLGRWIFEYFAY